MVVVLERLDAVLAKSRVLWRGAGQLALVLLGVHLGANAAASGLAGRAGGWLPDAALAWLLLVAEALALVAAADAIALTPPDGVPAWQRWRRTLTVQAAVVPVAWAAWGLAGCQALALAVGDVLPQAPWAGPLLACLAGWRLGWTGWRRVVAGLPGAPRSVWRGLGWAPLLLASAAASLRALPWATLAGVFP